MFSSNLEKRLAEKINYDLSNESVNYKYRAKLSKFYLSKWPFIFAFLSLIWFSADFKINSKGNIVFSNFVVKNLSKLE